MTDKKLISYPAVHSADYTLIDGITAVLAEYNQGKPEAATLKLVPNHKSDVITIQNDEGTFIMIVVEKYSEPILHVDFASPIGNVVQSVLQLMEDANKKANNYHRFNSYA